MGEPERFVNEIEQVLRNTLGFKKLRAEHSNLAQKLMNGVRAYAHDLQEPNKPLELVDRTGFSLQSIETVQSESSQEDFGPNAWDAESLFSQGNRNLQAMMGVLLQVPELRDNLKVVTGGDKPDGDKLAMIIKDWVNGKSILDIAMRYYYDDSDDDVKAMTKCGQNLFGQLTQTTAWGLRALFLITGDEVPEDQMPKLSNLPSRVYYGVNDDDAIALRLLGVPRAAASKLAGSMDDLLGVPLTSVRSKLRDMDEAKWKHALGEREGRIYRRVWRVLEGLDS